MLDTADPLAFTLRWLFLGAAVGYFLMIPVALVLGI